MSSSKSNFKFLVSRNDGAKTPSVAAEPSQLQAGSVYKVPPGANIITVMLNNQVLQGNEVIDGKRISIRKAGRQWFIQAGDETLITLDNAHEQLTLEGEYWTTLQGTETAMPGVAEPSTAVPDGSAAATGAELQPAALGAVATVATAFSPATVGIAAGGLGLAAAGGGGGGGGDGNTGNGVDNGSGGGGSTTDTTVASLSGTSLSLVTDTGSNTTDKLINNNRPAITLSSLAGKAFLAGDKIEIIETINGTATVVGSYTVQASDLDTAGLWRGTTLNITLTSALSDGLHTLTARVNDTVGNTGASSTALGVTIDTSAPSFSNNGFDVNENTASVTTLREVNLASNETVTFSNLAGVDADKFTLTSTGKLQFKDALNFEQANDETQNNVYIVSVTATDSAGNSRTQDIAITVQNLNEAPTNKANLPASTLVSNQAFSLNLSPYFQDPDAGNLTGGSFTFSGLPAGLSYDAATQTIQGSTTAAAGSYNVTVTFTDKGDATGANQLSVSQNWALTVSGSSTGGGGSTGGGSTGGGSGGGDSGGGGGTTTDTTVASLSGATLSLVTDTGSNTTDNLINNNKPAITLSSLAGKAFLAGDKIEIIETVSNATVVRGSYTVQSSDLDTAGLWKGTTLNITLTSALSDGPHTLTARVNDTVGNIGASSASLGVSIDTSVPSFTQTSFDVKENTASDASSLREISLASNEAVTFSDLAGVDAGKFTLTAGGKLAFKDPINYEQPVDDSQNRVYNLSVTATDTAGNPNKQDIVINVQDVNEAPTNQANLPATTLVKNQSFSLNLNPYFQDPDTGNLTGGSFTVTGLPAGLSYNSSTQTITGSATAAAGSYNVTVTFTDKGDSTGANQLSVSQNWALAVQDPPTIANQVNGIITAGPLVAGHGLSVVLYKADGVTFVNDNENASTAIMDVGGVPGKFTLNVGAYTGVVVAKVVDKSTGVDFNNEANNRNVDLSAQLFAVGVVPPGASTTSLTLNINPLTTIAAQLAGVAADTGTPSTALSTTTVTNANSATASAFGLPDITTTAPNTTNDTTTSINTIGAVLAALSGVDSTGSQQATINAYKAAITQNNAAGSLSAAKQLELVDAAAAVETSVSATDLVKTLTDTLASKNSPTFSINAIGGSDSIINATEFASAITLGGSLPTGATAVSLRIAGAAAVQASVNTNTGTWSYTIPANSLGADGAKNIEVSTTVNGSTLTATRTLVVNAQDNSPTSVLLGNAVTSLPENTAIASRYKVADINVLDDGLGSNTLSLTGADESRFEIFNNALYLRASAQADALNFESKAQYNVTVNASGGQTSGTVSTNYSLNLTDVNEAPKVNSVKGAIPNTMVPLNQNFNLDLSAFFEDPDAGGLQNGTYAVTGLPSGFTFNPNTGVITATPTSPATERDVTVTFTDAPGLSAQQVFKLMVGTAPGVQGFTVADNSGNTSRGKAGDDLTFTVTFTETVRVTGTLQAKFKLGTTEITADFVAATGGSTGTSFAFTGAKVPAGGNGTFTLVSLTGTATSTANGVQIVAPAENALSFTGYTVDNTAPAAPTVAEVGSSDLADNRMNNAEAATTNFRVTLPTTGSTAVTGDKVELLLGGASFATAKTVTLTSTNISDGYVDFSVLKADLGADGSKSLTAKITDVADNISIASTALSFTLDTSAPTQTIPVSALSLNWQQQQYAQLPTLAQGALGGDLTLQAWVYAGRTQNDFARILDFGNGLNSDNLWLGFQGGKVVFQAFNDASIVTTLISPDTLAVTQWQHVAVTITAFNPATNNQVVTLYINGTAVATGTFTQAINSDARSLNYLGKSNWPTDPYYDGRLADVRVYNDARTSSEILADMAGGMSGDNLVMAYSLNGNTSSGVSGGANATLFNSPTYGTFRALTLSADTGQPQDYVTNTAAQTIGGTLSSALSADDILEGSVNGGTTWTDITNKVSGTSITWTGAQLVAGSNSIVFRVKDLAGNVGASTGSTNYVLDTTGPDAVDLEATSGVQATNRYTVNSSEASAGKSIASGVQAPGASDISTIQLVLGGTGLDAAAGKDQLVFDVAQSLNANIGTVNNKTIGGVAVDYRYVASTKTFTITKNGGGAFAASTVDDIVKAILFKTTSTTQGDRTITVGYVDTAGNAGTTAVQTLTVNTIAPVGPSIAESGSSDLADSLMNNAEAATTNFRVTLPNTGVTAGDKVELLLGGASFATAKTSTLTSTNITDGYVDFTVLKADLGADGNKSLTAQVTYNNTSSVTSALSFTLDTSAPSVTASYNVNENTASDTTKREITLTTGTSGESVVFSNLTGTDAGLFTLSGNKLLLKDAINYESPNDNGGNRTYDLSIKASDQAGNETTQAITVNVQNVNEAPTRKSTSTSAVSIVKSVSDAANFQLNLQDYFADVDAGDLANGTYSITSTTPLPSWLQLQNGQITRSTTGAAEARDYPITVTFKDPGNLTVSETFNLQFVSGPAVQSFTVTDNTLDYGGTGTTNTAGKAGDALTFKVTFTESINVTGTLTARFVVDGKEVFATYTGSGGAAELTFITSTKVPAGVNGNFKLTDLTGTAVNASNNEFTPLNNGNLVYTAYTVDNTAPGAPGLALAFDNGSNVTDGITNNGAVKVTGLEAGSQWQYSTNNGSSWSELFDTSPLGNSFKLEAGQYLSGRVQARVVDKAGNSSSDKALNQDITIDTDAPASPVVMLKADTGASSTDNVTRNGEFTVTFSQDTTDWEYSTELDLNGNPIWNVGKALENDALTSSFVLPLNKTYAIGTINVQAFDKAGNSNKATYPQPITLDTTGPEISALSLDQDNGKTVNDGVTNKGLMKARFSADTVKWQYTFNGTSTGSTTWLDGSTLTKIDGSDDLSGSFTLAAGEYPLTSVRVRAYDKAGNETSRESTIAITVDTTRPEAPSAALVSDTGYVNNDWITSARSIKVSGMELGAQWRNSTNGGTDWSVWQDINEQREGLFDLSGSLGAEQLRFQTRDRAGNVSEARTITNAITLDITAPTLAPSGNLFSLAFTEIGRPPNVALNSSAGNSLGETQALTISFDGPVYGLASPVLNAPALTSSGIFQIGTDNLTATWSGQEGGTTRTLTYTVAPGQKGQVTINEAALKAALMASNGIKDLAGNTFNYEGNFTDIDPATRPLPKVDGAAPSATLIPASNPTVFRALALDSTKQQYAQLPALDPSQLGGDLTLESWVYVDSAPNANTRIFDFGNFSTKSLLWLGFGANGQIVFSAANVDANQAKLIGRVETASNALSSGWHHVAATVDVANKVTIYVDGRIAKEGALSSTLVMQTYPNNLIENYIGKSNFSVTDPYFNGRIADARVYNDARSQSEIQADMSGTTMGDQLVMSYRFDGNTSSGGGVVTNGANMKTDLTVNGVSPTTNAPGIPYPAFYSLSLDSTKQQYVQLPTLAAGALGGDLTLEAWVNAKDGQGSFARIFDLGSGAGNDNIWLGIVDGKLRFEAFNNAISVVNITSTAALATNSWQHVAVTVSANKVATIYINGAVAATGNLTAEINTDQRLFNYMGKSNWPADPYFNGRIADARVYDDARTVAEIQDDMNGILLNDDKLVMAYRYNSDNNAGTVPSSGGLITSSATLATAQSANALKPSTDVGGVTTNTLALQLESGQQQYVQLPGLATGALGGDLTLEAWVNSQGDPGQLARIFDLGTGAGKDNIWLGFVDGKICFEAYNNTTSLGRVITAASFAINKWQHVAVTVGANKTVTIYIDGEVAATGNYTEDINTNTRINNYIGKSNWPADAYFNGGIADARVYNDARTADEIKADRTGTQQGDNLLMAYSFNGSANGIVSSSGGSITGAAQLATMVSDPRKLPTTDAGGLLTVQRGITFSADTGLSEADYITSSATQTLTGKYSTDLVPDDEKVYVSVDGGTNWREATTINSSNASDRTGTWTLSGATLIQGSNTVKVKIVDATGNESPSQYTPYTLDAIRPQASWSSTSYSDNFSNTENLKGWTLGSGVSFRSEGPLIGDLVRGANASGTLLSKNFALNKGHLYTVSFDFNMSSGTLRLSNSNTDNVNSFATITNSTPIERTTYTRDFLAVDDGFTLATVGSTWTGLIDNFKITQKNTTATNNGAVYVQSTEAGAAYVVQSSATVTNLSSITGLSDNQWNSVAINALNTPTALNLAGLQDGTYKLYTTDRAGNLSDVATNTVTVNAAPPTASYTTAIVQNGTADSGLANWTSVGATQTVVDDGNVFILGAANVTLSQGLKLAPLQAYNLSFKVGAFTTNTPFNTERYTVEIVSGTTTTTLVQPRALDRYAMLNMSIDFCVLGGTDHTLRFKSLTSGDSQDLKLDDVVVTPKYTGSSASGGLAPQAGIFVSSNEGGQMYLVNNTANVTDLSSLLALNANQYVTVAVNANVSTFLSTQGLANGNYKLYAADALGSLSAANSQLYVITATATPLVLDLNGDGVRTTDVAHGVLFDVNDTGSPLYTGWVDAHDGLLVLDLNRDGRIHSGAELFGSGTTLASTGGKAADGYAALRAYDLNADGVINALDAVFKDLQVWQDSNTDGVSDAGELHTLASLGIASLDLNALAGAQVDNGNTLALVSSWTDSQGQSHQMADVWFATTAPDNPLVLVDHNARAQAVI